MTDPDEVRCHHGHPTHEYWPKGRPQNICDRCGRINPTMSRFIAELNERASFLGVTWDEALRRMVDDAAWRLERL